MQFGKTLLSITLLCCAIFFCRPLSAQTPNPIKLGLKISPNLGWMSPTTKDYSSGKISTGATIGLISEFYFAERYAITTGLNFAFLNGNLKYSDSLRNTDTVFGQMNRKIKIIYLEVPLMIKMSTKQFGDFSFYGQAGFTAGFRLSATAKDEFVSTKGETFNEKKDFSGGTTLMRVSASIGIGTEYHLDKSTRIILGLTYSNSLNNVLKGQDFITKSDVKAWLNYLELNIGILF